MRTGPPDPGTVLFHYDARRNYGALEQRLRPCLADFNGVIVTDEHGLYNTLVKNHTGIRAHGGCLAHCRRKFAAFLDHPEMPLGNNAMEQAIRPFTLGRKNCVFAGSPSGANASAFIYSLIESAKANGLEPYHYLCCLFELYPLATSDDERRLLLSWNLQNSD